MRRSGRPVWSNSSSRPQNASQATPAAWCRWRRAIARGPPGTDPKLVLTIERGRLGEILDGVGRGRQGASSGQNAGEVEHLVLLGVPGRCRLGFDHDQVLSVWVVKR